MIKLPKDFFSNLTPAQYKEQLKLLPKLTDEKTQLYMMLSFTLLALTFFGIFAINPTLSTIAELKRQFADLQFVYEKLITKTQTLSLLQQKYQAMGSQIPYVFNALPQKPDTSKFLAQINALIARSNLEPISLRTYGVEITPDKKTNAKSPMSFVFSIEAAGTYEDILSFIQSVTKINRLVVVEMVSIDKDDKRDALILNLRGREYFKP